MPVARIALTCLVLLGAGAATLRAQVPVDGEVRQIVTFSFLPGKAAEAMQAYREQAIPLYRADEAMLSFRAFREVESPVPLDLMVVSAFRGMAGMDASNAALRDLAVRAGTSIGAIYGRLGALSTGHTDQFVEMLPRLGSGDPSAPRLTAFVWYRVASGREGAFEAELAGSVVPWEASQGVRSATGRFLVSDGFSYLRLLGFDSLGAYQAYWDDVERSGHGRIAALTAARREVIVANDPESAVR